MSHHVHPYTDSLSKTVFSVKPLYSVKPLFKRFQRFEKSLYGLKSARLKSDTENTVFESELVLKSLGRAVRGSIEIENIENCGIKDFFLRFLSDIDIFFHKNDKKRLTCSL
ncbi:MAG: hypothetical protein BWK80_17775 [Desulfobacteraceae bacterium IS3]|nr:MAG: hypothetical protein BWK80_17775 [Desulfobacteraceae bacterium IS3]